MDWTKIISNAYHIALVVLSAYLAAHPADYGWLIPALQALGQTAPPPDFQPAMKLEGVPHV